MPKQKLPMPKIIITPPQDIVGTIQSLSHAQKDKLDDNNTTN